MPRHTAGATAVIRARFRIELPGDVWASEVSRSFPDATLRLLTGVPMGDTALELGEVRAADPAAVTDAIRSHPDVTGLDRLYGDDERVISQYEAAEKSLYEFLWGSSFPPEFPMLVEDGEMEFDVTATREQFEAFGSALDTSEIPYELLTVVHTDDSEGLLTDRQRECLTVAHQRGYFEVPRQCDLTELGAALGVDKSTASETLRRATDRVVGQFLLGHDDN
ncbi:helix-turn-helix domain-containing protein [Halobellus rufus]|uniref:helix-turn-helix domain-containing protein n=1 Tax=Halobellus rufus TaxID=1448860 RepID=UPI0012E076C6|nr:helix-turn-helix domain-containing protein [Halobellus rufus]